MWTIIGYDGGYNCNHVAPMGVIEIGGIDIFSYHHVTSSGFAESAELSFSGTGK